MKSVLFQLCRRNAAALCGLVCVLCLTGADWRQFRGTEVNGLAVDGRIPSSFSSDENVAWKIDLPGRGLSGPIVVGDRIYVTASSGFRQDRLHVLCFDRKSGDRIFERQFWATGRTMCHPKMCVATPTPASDGTRIFASYSSNDVACLDLDGNLLWYRGLTHDYPNASNSLGMSSSPIVVDETLSFRWKMMRIRSQSGLMSRQANHAGRKSVRSGPTGRPRLI